jgi:hypothetical protein
MDVQLYDGYVGYLTSPKNERKYPTTFPSSKSNFKRDSKKFAVEDGVLFWTHKGKHKKVLKVGDIELVWQQFHNHDLHSGTSTLLFFFDNHLFCCLSGAIKTYQKIHDRYYFWGLQDWVRNRSRECPVCSELKTVSIRAKRTPLIAIPVVPKVFWRVHIDLAGPFRESSSGSKYVALAICAFIKYAEIEGTFFRETKQTKNFIFFCLFLF